MKPPFIGRRFANLLPRQRPSATRVLRTFHTLYKRGDPNAYQRRAGTPDDLDDGQRRDPHRRKKRFLYSRAAEAWYNTPTKWYPLPVGVGALLLGAIQYKKRYLSNQAQQQIDDEDDHEIYQERARLQRPWQVHVLGSLPLRNLSRLWGYLNSFELPVWARPTGFKLYAWIFNCNLDEIEHADDLSRYVSLGDFFYRKLQPGVRPIADASLVSPADGKILHYGVIDTSQGYRIEQVKGVTYSLDGLLGLAANTTTSQQSQSPSSTTSSSRTKPSPADVADREFANVNGIEYSLGQLLGNQPHPNTPDALESSGTEAMGDGGYVKEGPTEDATTSNEASGGSVAKDLKVAAELGVGQSIPTTRSSSPMGGRSAPSRRSTASEVKPGNRLYFAVIYLAPGDYHRFHSPAAWVVEKRRHFTGELFSVSPFLARRLAGLFVLNERVALLGRWRHGFFSMVPVGATNVGSIILNFDAALRTNLPNSRSRPHPPPGTYNEATYSHASTILKGQPLVAGQEMGGFSLGSTIVLVFEAPAKGWKWDESVMKEGGIVKVGMKLGDVVS
ncbi:phosphatidylserine decarboxylase 1 [Tulasnella sp. 330]|nr:phosphatidylserine decarboxylase 1 [Tulasnella sp. 330]KAG8880361.1 phosphatidylserine decarboxylase 1 [Tulasnella sp. 331]KAG8882491.1 phosphatidylserine decarboxylase 1 [Tulasnella sp. 332]